ncbi:MAG: serine/threonine protein kinase [Deltaproteobacteria bacterium]|nr:serine/threonine protein kinase [Deltaproteobacteria bacterium]
MSEEEKEKKQIDVYDLVRILGTGGMGIVYEAKHRLIGRRCAIKVLHEALETNEELLTRMVQEARAASAIGHPNIVEVYDFRRAPDGAAYMVMELMDGKSLEQILDEQGHLSPRAAAVVMSHILSALQAAHHKHIVHRDLKPDNIFISRDRQGGYFAKVLDFGISKFTDSKQELNLTRTGAVLGSPYYMSPEQASGKRDLDGRCDLWAAGIIFFEMLTGIVPFDGENYNEVMANILIKPHITARSVEPDLPAIVDRIVDRALEKNRIERYGSAAEMMADITELLPDGPVDVGGFSLSPQSIQVQLKVTDQRAPEMDKTMAGLGIAADGQALKESDEAEDSDRRAVPADNTENPTAPFDGRLSLSDPGRRQVLPKETITSGENMSQSFRTLDVFRHGQGRLVLAGASLLLLIAAIGTTWYLLTRSSKALPSHDRALRPAATPPQNGASHGLPDAPVVASRKDGAIAPGPMHGPTAMRPRTHAMTAMVQPGTMQPATAMDAGASMASGTSVPSPRPDKNHILITLQKLPAKHRIWLDGRPVKNPIMVQKDHREHCVQVKVPGFPRYLKCFFAYRDRSFRVWLRRKPRPRSIYDSPY